MMEDKIRVVDGDGSITGRVKDLNLFTVILETEDGKTVTLPNNLILQQPVEVSIHACGRSIGQDYLKLPEDHMGIKIEQNFL